MSDLQNEYVTWAVETFPYASSHSIIAHLIDEVKELDDANWIGLEELQTEAADCYLLLLHLAHRNGFDLETAARNKFEINKRRSWNTVTDRGYTRHDTEEDDASCD